jgi:hypothetical protein
MAEGILERLVQQDGTDVEKAHVERKLTFCYFLSGQNMIIT